MPEKCRYEQEDYKCEEDAVKDGLCIFHHPEYWKEHKEEVRKKFMEKVEDAINNKKPLICIGYNLPEVDLSDKKFEAPVYFTGAIFHEGANFSSTKFSSIADFYGATFRKGADFSLAEFSSEAYFDSANFSSMVDFQEVKFSGATVFNKTKFLGKALFDYAAFLDAVSFVNSDFSPDVLEKCLDPYNYISFRHSNFERQEKVMFDGCNIERVSFLYTDIERVKFRNVNWGDFKIYDEKLFLLKHLEKERKKFVEDGKIKLNKLLKVRENEIDEIKSEVEEAITKKGEEIEKNILENVNEDEDLTLDNVLAVYRALRENYDYYLKYDESGKFFINEMKLKKRFSNFIERVVMSAYELLCLYGESYTRTIVWILVTIPLFALARLLFEASSLVLNMNSLMDSLKISTAAFFQLYYDNDWLTIIERLISIPILGSFYIALRRKLERRIRH